jgi:hypothetical protein
MPDEEVKFGARDRVWSARPGSNRRPSAWEIERSGRNNSEIDDSPRRRPHENSPSGDSDGANGTKRHQDSGSALASRSPAARASGLGNSHLRRKSVEPSVVDPNRYPCRRPIQLTEIPALRALGSEVRALRFDGGRLVVGTKRFAQAAQVPQMSLWRIETGVRRTRASTLRRIAKAAARLNPNLGSSNEVLERLLKTGGESIAPESQYQYRVHRPRMRRFRKGSAKRRLRKQSRRTSVPQDTSAKGV